MLPVSCSRLSVPDQQPRSCTRAGTEQRSSTMSDLAVHPASDTTVRGGPSRAASPRARLELPTAPGKEARVWVASHHARPPVALPYVDPPTATSTITDPRPRRSWGNLGRPSSLPLGVAIACHRTVPLDRERRCVVAGVRDERGHAAAVWDLPVPGRRCACLRARCRSRAIFTVRRERRSWCRRSQPVPSSVPPARVLPCRGARRCHSRSRRLVLWGAGKILDEGVYDESVCRRSDGGDRKAAGAASG